MAEQRWVRTTWTGAVGDLTRVAPAPGSRWVALRAAVTMLTGLLLLDAAGALDHAAYVTFGAFASVYGGPVRSPRRWRTQAWLGFLLTAAVGCGAAVGTVDHRAWVVIPVAAAVASGAAWLSDRSGWRPPGPMFLVFAVTTCAAIPTAPAGVATAVALAAGTAVLAVALGAVEVALARVTGHPGPPPRPGPVPSPARRRLHVLRCAVAVAVAGLVTTATGSGHPYWAMTSAVVPLAVVTLHRQVARGLHRVAGTLAGLVVAAVLLLLPLPALAVVVIVAVLQGTTELLVARHYGAALVTITPLALLIGQVAAPQPVGALLLSRLVETVIGIAVGVLTAVLTRDRSAHAAPHAP